MYLFWDTETALFGPANKAPPLTCISWSIGKEAGLLGLSECRDWLLDKLADENIVFVGHNVAYDFAVVCAEFPELYPLVFEAYRNNRVTDTMLRTQLLDIAIGQYRGKHVTVKKETAQGVVSLRKFKKWGYSLDDCHARANKGKRLVKDTWRKHYGMLRNVPLHKWPKGAQTYPIEDARATEIVFNWGEQFCVDVRSGYQSIRGGHIDSPEPLADQFAQARAAWWIQLMSVWGLRTNADRVEQLREVVEGQLQTTRAVLVAHGLVRKNGQRDTKAAKARMIKVMGGEENCKRTDKDQISLDEEACNNSNDEVLMQYAELTSLGNVLSKDIPALLSGTYLPIHSSFDVIKVTGRTSSRKPNVQNVRRLEGLRECFVPREGKVFLDCDYDTLELRTLAQVLLHFFGKSALADVINANKDPHLLFASKLLGISYEEAELRKKEKVVKDARQLSKAFNFGTPGGLGVDTFMLFARKQYGVELTRDQVIEYRRFWFDTFPEVRLYFDMISKHGKEDREEGLANVEHLFTKRLRGDCTYTAACNSYFQGLGADCTKHAGFNIAYECYVDESSPLFGCRIVNYIHDQFLLECDEEKADAAVRRLAKVMEDSANEFLTGVKATVSEPMISRCWSKETKQVFDEAGRLIPWDIEGGYSIKTKTVRKYNLN